MALTDKLMKARSNALITAMVGKEAGKKWWDSPNRAFDMRTPNEQWTIDSEAVYNYLMDAGFNR